MATEVINCTLADVGPVSIRIRPVAINLLVANPRVGNQQPSYSFDLSGRLIGAFVDGVNYRRALDGRVLAKWPGSGGRERRWLPADEADALLTHAHDLADGVAHVCSDPRLAVLSGWTAERRAEDVAAFRRIYQPVSILPPDQYLALVIQATEGCSYNRCTFCDFYENRPFRIKSPGELRTHISDVQAFFGPAIGLRRSLFLADANALVAPMSRVRSWLDVIDEAGVRRPGGIFSFMDAFDVGRKAVEEWFELAGRGLRRVYIGMESGDDALLQFLRKPGTASDVIEAVRTLKSAGVAVSVIIMTGVGGDRFARTHEVHTIAALNAMPLGKGDIVYFSPFFEQPGSEYGRLATAAGIKALSPGQIRAQEAALLAGIRSHSPALGTQVSRYDIREFVY